MAWKVLGSLIAVALHRGLSEPCECKWLEKAGEDGTEMECAPDMAKAKALVKGNSKAEEVLDTMEKEQACEISTSKSSCQAKNDCAWEEGKGHCGAGQDLEKKMMDLAGGGNPMMEIMMKASTCDGLTDEPGCKANTDCEWSQADKECGPSQALLMQMVSGGGGGGMGGMMELGMKAATCQGIVDEPGCGANQDCGWNEQKCDLNPALAMQMMFGGGAGGGNSSMGGGIMQMVMTCGMLDNANCGSNTDCTWEDGTCDVSPEAAMSAVMGKDSPMSMLAVKAMTCEALETSGDCGGNTDCNWEGDKCDIDGAALASIMGDGGGFMGTMQELSAKEAACEGLTASGIFSCQSNSDCEWMDPTCNISSALAAAVYAPYMAMMQECSLISTDGPCNSNQNCTWTPESGNCTVNPFLGMDSGFSDFMMKMQECSSKMTGSACGEKSDTCKWDGPNDECSLKDEEMLKFTGMNGMEGGTDLMGKVIACSGVTSQAPCDQEQDCMWDEGECTLDGEVMMMALMGGGPGGGGGNGAMPGMMDFDEREKKCKKHTTKDACGKETEEKCVYHGGNDKCELSSEVYMKMMMGEGGKEVDRVVKRADECLVAGSSDECKADACLESTDADAAWFATHYSQLVLLAVAFLHVFSGLL